MTLIGTVAGRFCPVSLADVRLAAALLERDACVIIMLCGTAGTGKSTLAGLLGQRLGITNIVSTDALRSTLRCAPLGPDPLSTCASVEAIVCHARSCGAPPNKVQACDPRR